MSQTPPEQQSTDLTESVSAGSDFEKQAAGKERGVVGEFLAFLGENKRWWLIPIIISLLLLAFLLFLGQGPLAPFVYTLF